MSSAMSVSLDERIIRVGKDDLHWPFRGEPYYPAWARDKSGYATRICVDPFPWYAHEARRVMETAQEIEARFPMGYLPNYYLLPWEESGRTNGHANRHRLYSRSGDLEGFEPYIVLSGKRIPLHPAMTRYLTAHEYGHCVQWWIERKLQIKERADLTDFDTAYARLRGVEADDGYGGGRWHAHIGELIANDFRICVGGIESEFWPHPGFDHPETLPQVQQFWTQCVARFAGEDPAPVGTIKWLDELVQALVGKEGADGAYPG